MEIPILLIKLVKAVSESFYTRLLNPRENKLSNEL